MKVTNKILKGFKKIFQPELDENNITISPIIEINSIIEISNNKNYLIRFTPDIRKIIIGAGKSHTLVKLVENDDSTHLVEPYYFVTRFREFDKFEIEFLLGFNSRTKKKKMFPAEEIKEAYSTSISFVPRKPINLK